MDHFTTKLLMHALSFVICVPIGIYLGIRSLRKRIDSINM